MIGQMLGPYHVLAKLGEGGMGEVFLAEDTRLRRRVALKLLPTRLADDDKARQRLINEARAVAALDHPNICTVYEVGEADGHRYIAMQYIEGETLASRLRRGCLDRATALSVAAQVVQALAEAHRQNVVHRDIKPHNIMLTKSGRAIVLDFGLAKSIGVSHDSETEAMVTGAGEIAGTIAYMSPEQARGEPLDPRTDVFSFGTTLYEMIAGRHPFAGGPATQTASRLLTSDPAPFDVPVAPEVQRILSKCLEKDRERRYQTTRDLLIDLENAHRSTHASGSTPSSIAPAWKAPALPTSRTTLVGRERERRAAAALLRRPDVRLVTFTGAGGTGKTRLALQVAADLAPSFDGRVFFVTLAPISDPALVAPTVATAIGVREIGNRDPLQVITEVLAADGAPALLVLDSFEQVLDATPVVTEILERCANVTIVVTSRAVLRVYGEHDFDVPPLDLPDRSRDVSLADVQRSAAVDLFVQRAKAVKPDFWLTPDNAPAIAEICARLDGLPLAIELAAARIRTLTPAAMLQRLQSRFELLTGGARDLPVRQRTLLATVEWSHGQLTEQEQKLFRRLSVFLNGCTLEAIEAVCNAPEDLTIDVLDGMESLAGQSLVVQAHHPEEETRFTLLETMREYGAQRLKASAEAHTIHKAHAAYCLVLAEEGAGELDPDEREQWLSRCRREQDNLRAALEWTAENGEIEWGLRLGAALHAFWHARGLYAEGRERLRVLLNARGQASGKTRARALSAAGNLAMTQFDLDAAQSFYEASLAISRDANEPAGIVSALNALAYTARSRGDHARARTLFEECLERSEQAGDLRAIARSLINLGHQILKYEGDAPGAAKMYLRAHEIAAAQADVAVSAMCENHLGDVARATGDSAAARERYEQALRTFERRGDRTAAALTLVDLGELLSDSGDFDGGHGFFVRAIDTYRQLGNKLGIARVADAMAHAAARQGRADRAIRLAAAAAAIRRSLGAALPHPAPDEARRARELAQARQSLGTATNALERDARALSIDQVIDYAVSGS